MNKEATKPESSQKNDELMIRSFLEGESRAFDRLVVKYKDMIFNLCIRILNDYDEADDCSQETFIKAYYNLKDFRFQSSFLTWLYRIAINTCKNRLSSRERRFHKTSVRMGDKSEGKRDLAEVGDHSYDPGMLFEKNEQKRQIDHAIGSLPRDLRILVILRDLEGRSYEEISQATGTNIGTVKSRLARARSQLRDFLRGVL